MNSRQSPLLGSGVQLHSVSVVIALGKRPVTFRTRKLSLSAPMVLQGGPCGRVGHRRTIFPDPWSWPQRRDQGSFGALTERGLPVVTGDLYYSSTIRGVTSMSNSPEDRPERPERRDSRPNGGGDRGGYRSGGPRRDGNRPSGGGFRRDD